jgi:hypothetical protein
VTGSEKKDSIENPLVAFGKIKTAKQHTEKGSIQ